MYYNQNACRQWQTVEINRFSPEQLEWENSIEIRHEVENLNDCEIKMLAFRHRPAMDIKLQESGAFNISGYAVDFFETFSKFYNFKVVYIVNDLTKMELPEFEFLAQAASMISYGHLYGENPMSKPFSEKQELIIIAHGELYTPLVKLFLPFDMATWIWISIYMVVGAVVIVIVKFTPKLVQSFIFGRNVRTPGQNMSRAFFGISQTILPGRNFARYLLMMFILFCLIIRTAYQSKMFEFLQKEIRKPEFKLIQELIKNNFSFISVHC